MAFFSRMSPVRAYKDLRLFLSTREKHEFVFLALALGVTGFLIYGFYRDSTVAPVYKRDIIYVEQWAATRSDAEIRAQQAIDGPIKAKAIAERDAALAKRRAEFKKLDDQMTAWGL